MHVTWTTHCLKPMGFLLRRPRNLLAPQALIWTVPALYCYSFYAICLNPSSNIFFIFFATLMSLSCIVPQAEHTNSFTDSFWVSVFWYPQTEHNWLLASIADMYVTSNRNRIFTTHLPLASIALLLYILDSNTKRSAA